jgi:xanthine dehydrogenase YagS FAD-binding subunit
MRPFDYTRATGVPEAVALLAGNSEARFLGGGTNLVDLMKTGVERPALLVDVRGLPLDRIEVTGGGALRIGATVTNSDVAADPEVRRRYPALAEAVLAGASGQLRNMATVGGNLLQRTRCGYFGDTTQPCNKRVPGSGCPALTGEHHNHAILDWSEHCVATHPSDMGVALAAFDAVVAVHTADGPTELPLAEFYRPVGDTPHLETTLPPGALITAVTLPDPGTARSGSARRTRSPTARSRPPWRSRTGPYATSGSRSARSPPVRGARGRPSERWSAGRRRPRRSPPPPTPSSPRPDP